MYVGTYILTPQDEKRKKVLIITLPACSCRSLMGIFTFYAFCVHALTMRALLVQIKLDCIHSSIILQRNMWIIDCKCISTYLQFYLGRLQVHTYQCTMGFNPEKVQFRKATVLLLCFHHDSCCFASKANIKIFIESFFLFSTHYPGEKCHASNKVVQLFQQPTYLECFESPIPLLTYYFCSAIVGGIL